MSFSRWGKDSDVYTFPHVDGYYTCCACPLLRHASSHDFQDFTTPGLETFLIHLDHHRDRGDKVPISAYEGAVDWDRDGGFS